MLASDEPFMVAASYTGLDDAKFPTKGKKHDIGRITRDGTEVHIPYLSTYAGYNHRITMSNRSARDTTYTLTFRTEEGVMAEPGMDAKGELKAGQTLVLSARDVVTLTGGARTAASLTLPLPADRVDVSTTLVNKETGTAAVTVHWSPSP